MIEFFDGSGVLLSKMLEIPLAVPTVGQKIVVSDLRNFRRGEQVPKVLATVLEVEIDYVEGVVRVFCGHGDEE